MSEKKGILGGLFGGKKSECCCGTSCSTDKTPGKEASGDAKPDIKVLGPGCKNCITLEENTKEALKQMGVDASLEKVTDLARIAGYGVMSTPGLVVNGKVVSFGKVLKPADIVKILEKTL
jgi:small redox-active disulfide protein 2